MDRERFAHSPVGHLVDVEGIDGRFNVPYKHIAFVAVPLELEPPLRANTWHAVTAANRALARLDQASRLIPKPQLLRRPTLRREAQSTSALEGTFAPLEQVLAAEVTDQVPSKELLEVLNYIEAANYAFEWVATRERLTVGMLESAQALLVRGTESETEDAGRVRRTLVAIGSSTGSIQDARFMPMPPGIELNSAIQDLVTWISDTEAPRDPLVAAAMAHYQFETLHPFNDGNGRIGRLMVVLQMLLTDLLHEPLLSVSPWFEARRPAYQDQLAEVSATGNWDAWITFFAQGIESSADDAARRINRLLAVQNRYIQRSQEHGAHGIIRDIVDLLIGDPVVSIPLLTRRLERTPQAISTAVGRLVELRILSSPVGNYNRQYIATDMWRAVTAPVGSVADADASTALDDL
jgi:Fic family protein